MQMTRSLRSMVLMWIPDECHPWWVSSAYKYWWKCYIKKNMNETITDSSNQKLIVILFNNIYFFRWTCTFIMQELNASQKLNALARVAHYMNLARCRLIMNVFIFLQFGYCPLKWMFHYRKLNNHINSFHECALRIVSRDYKSTFQQ